nr:patatin-like phospholipase family protein [Paraferrimonas sp. SM1919]
MLGGGGARAAYQVGVLKAIAELYPRNHGLPFKIICGSSAGAINSCALGCYASSFHLGVRKLEWVWHNMSSKNIFKSSTKGVLAHLLAMMVRKFTWSTSASPAVSVFNTKPLAKLLEQVIDFKMLDKNIADDYLHAISVDASSYNQNSSISFYQGNVEPWQRDGREGIKEQLTVDHLMASAGIPILFPSIKIKNRYYGDGAICQFSPLSTPIHLGADKILVINLESHIEKQTKTLIKHPSMAQIFGQIMEIVFADTLNADIERVERINKTVAHLNASTRQKLGLKPIEMLLFKPSLNLSELALKHYYSLPWAVRWLLKMIGGGNGKDPGIISYMLFENSFSRELIKLGEQDALARADEIKDFFELQ